MDSSDSYFSQAQQPLPIERKLEVGGSTSDCFLVRLYGKLHFLKRLKEPLRSDPRYVAALRKEFETGYHLEHPHLVRYVSMTDDAILMEYVDGETLDTFSQHHPDFFAKRKNTDRLLLQLLDVVGYLHAHQVVHLDLKPSNILITRIGNEVKLVDLGFCYADAYPDTMGRTDKYAAPEQLQPTQEKPSARTDIYAIGKILQHLPCERSYQGIIRKCTASHPADRFASTDEMARQLHRPASVRRILFPALLLLLLALILLVVFRPFSSQTIQSSSLDSPAMPNDSVASSPVAPSQPIPDEASSTIAPSSPSSSNPSPSNPSPVPSISSSPSSPAAVTSESATRTTKKSKALSTAELKQRIQAVVEPVFRQTMGHLRDSAWNSHTEQLYYKFTLPFKNQAGEKVRALWRQLSKAYDIDEYAFYHLYSDVDISLQNNLYNQMKQNSSRQGE